MHESSDSQFFNHHLNTIRTRRFWWIKVCYDLFNHLGSYRNILQFQTSSRWEKKQRCIWFIKIRFLRKVFSEQFCFNRCRKQHFWAVELRKYSKFTFFEITMSFLDLMNSFISVAYASLADSKTLLQRLLACLKFTLD